MRILIAEDDPSIAEGLQRSLRQMGYAIDWMKTGPDADRALDANQFDLLILDLGLPQMPGLEVLARLRERESRRSAPRTPVLILTARDGVDDRVRGLDTGADDYLAKPFELAEIQARVRALARRAPGGSTLITHGALSYDRVSHDASLNGAPLELSARESCLLEIFLNRSGHLVSKDQLVRRLGEWGDEVSVTAIDLYVNRLCKKLEPGGVRLVTVPGLGFSLEKPDLK
jgi:two-component system, OmpR family, response regulator